MDHPSVMGVGHRLANVLEDSQEPRQIVAGVGTVLQVRGQSAPLDQLHGEVRSAVVE